MRRVLFICGRNKARSPTAQRIFESVAGLEVASAGVSEDADEVVTPEVLEWAQVIFVMEKAHRAKLARKFGNLLRSRKIICLDIPDKYAYMDPALVEILRSVVSRHLGLDV